jgi:hypothetical protein
MATKSCTCLFEDCKRPYFLEENGIEDMLCIKMMYHTLLIDMVRYPSGLGNKESGIYYSTVKTWTEEKLISGEWTTPKDIEYFVGIQQHEIRKLSLEFRVRLAREGMS